MNIRGYAKPPLYENRMTGVLSTFLLMPQPTGCDKYKKQRILAPRLGKPRGWWSVLLIRYFSFPTCICFWNISLSTWDGQGKEKTWNFPACTPLKCHLTACPQYQAKKWLTQALSQLAWTRRLLDLLEGDLFPTQQTSQFTLQQSQY